jgi:LPXTG-motif cell wall-anchored protein
MSDWLEILTDSWVIIVGLAVIGLLGLGYYLWRRREAQRLPTDSNLAESIDKVTKWSPENEDE